MSLVISLLNLNMKAEVAREVSKTIPENFTKTLNVLYFPQLGESPTFLHLPRLFRWNINWF